MKGSAVRIRASALRKALETAPFRCLRWRRTRRGDNSGDNVIRRERPDGFYKALDDVYRALGTEHVRALGPDDRLELYAMIVKGISDYLAEDRDVSDVDALKLILERIGAREFVTQVEETLYGLATTEDAGDEEK